MDESNPRVFAGWWKRVAGSTIDAIIELALTFIGSLLFIFSLWNRLGEFLHKGEVPDPRFYMLVFFVYFVFSIAFTFVNRGIIQWYYNGSLGKLLLGLRLEMVDAREPSLLRVICRVFASSLSSLFFYFGYLFPLWTKNRQTLHDLICSTVVVEKTTQPQEGVLL